MNRQDESNDQEEKKGQVRMFVFSMPHKQMVIIQNLKETHRVCRAWNLMKFKELTISMKLTPLCMKNDWHRLK